MAALIGFKKLIDLDECPICGEKFRIPKTREPFLVKVCDVFNKFADEKRHKIYAQYSSGEIQICQIQYKNNAIYWDYYEKLIFVSDYNLGSGNRKPIGIPWVEPDFSDYKNFHKRIERLLVFS